MDHSKINNVSLGKKCLFLSGNDNWHTRKLEEANLDSIMMTDGPNGVRKCQIDTMVIESSTEPATVFPCNVLLGSTWNKEIAYKYGKALGEEAKDKGVSILLGPGVNIKRNPLCGRNFEYLSEDPYLAGFIAASYIDGLQSNKVAASLKHFAANNQENYRNLVDEIIDERALREIYLKPFEIATKLSQPKTIMTSYNKINGAFSSDNKWLLDNVARKEWGFKGIFVSDWRGLGHVVKATEAGLNLEMPTSGTRNAKILSDAVNKGLIKESTIDKRVYELAKFVNECQKNKSLKIKVDYNQHHELAKEIAGDGMVLLKNENDILPLKETEKVFFVGDFLYKDKFEGNGSSHATPRKLINLFNELGGVKNAEFGKGYDLDLNSLKKEDLIDVKGKALKTDKVVVFIGPNDTIESEGYDRKNLKLPKNQLKLINYLYKYNKNIIIVLINGAPYELPFVNKVSAVLEAYLGGEAYSEALKDVLYGKIVPSGRLAETFPLKYNDVPSSRFFPGGSKTSEYRESIFVGYRYYDTYDKKVLYPFGYGLSYSKFIYRNLSLTLSKKDLIVSFYIKNYGLYKAKEVSEIYIGSPSSDVFKPKKELKDFIKNEFDVREGKVLRVKIPLENLKYYNVKEKRWVLSDGDYTIYVGGDSLNPALTGVINISSEDNAESPYNKDNLTSYYNGKITSISKKEFSNLIGGKLSGKNARWFPPFNEDSCFNTISHTIVGAILKHEIGKNQTIKDNPEYLKQLYQMPFRQLIMLGCDNITDQEIKGFYDFINGHTSKKNSELTKSLFSKLG